MNWYLALGAILEIVLLTNLALAILRLDIWAES